MAINFDKVPNYIRKEIDPPKKTLTVGSRGNDVRQVQEWLQYHKSLTAIDGDFGPATRAALIDFQLSIGLGDSGEVDEETWQRLVMPMTNALKQPILDPDQSIPDVIATVAKQHVEQHPIEIGGQNRGPWVRLYCEGNDGIQWAWCAGFVTLIMHQACFYREERVPIEGSVSCDTLAAQAKAKGLFVEKNDVVKGKFDWSEFKGACLFLNRRTPTDWTHTGFATAASGSGSGKNLVFDTIEGNTNDEGLREGFEACRRKRSMSGRAHYDFVALLPDD